MKKIIENFEEFELNQMNLIVGGTRELAISTSNADDVSDSTTDCTNPDCSDATTWSVDSTAVSDSSRSKD